MKAPKLFVFDMGDVVIRENHVWHDVFKRFGINVTNIRQLGPNASEAVRQALIGSIEEPEFWHLVEKDAGRKLEWENILEDSYTCFPIPGTIDLINSLKSLGMRVVCGTNNIRPFYNRINAEGYYDLFPKVYSSFKMGISKPDPEFWKYIATQEEVEPNEMFFTDDNISNIQAASELGIKTRQFLSAEDLRECLAGLGFIL